MKRINISSSVVHMALLGACGACVPEPGVDREPEVCEGYTIRHESDLAEMATCTRVEGSMMIDVDDMADLRALENVRSVSGTLTIAGCAGLTSLDGLARLKTVENLVVIMNPRLQDMEALRGLSGARGVTIMKNPALRNLEGLEGLTRLDGLVLEDNGCTELHGLENLTQVDELVVSGNQRLRSLAGLRNLAQARVLHVENNPALATSQVLFESLERVDELIVLDGNSELSHLELQRLSLQVPGSAPVSSAEGG
jgi:hypothetical protein